MGVEVKNILLALDGSPESFDAVDAAIMMARAVDAKITALIVIDLDREVSAFERVSLGGYVEGYVPPELMEGAYKMLTELMREIPKDINIDTAIAVGDPKEEIVSRAEDGGYDMIVLGSRGFNMLEKILVGSVSQYVVENAECPVTIVRGLNRKKKTEQGE